MSFPASGQAIPSASGGSNISINDIRLSYVNNGNNGAWSGGDAKDSSEAPVSLSDFDGATFTSGSAIDGDGSPALSIGTNFCGRTFGSGTVTLTGVSFTSPDTTANGSLSEIIQFTAAPVPSNASGTITYAFTSSNTSGDASATPDVDNVYNTVTQMNYVFMGFDTDGGVNVIVHAKQNAGSAVGPATASVVVNPS